jgi:FMN-dependent NADH-azoreductase
MRTADLYGDGSNLVHWHWWLQYLDRIIEFIGYTMFARVAVEGSSEPTSEDLVRLPTWKHQSMSSPKPLCVT